MVPELFGSACSTTVRFGQATRTHIPARLVQDGESAAAQRRAGAIGYTQYHLYRFRSTKYNRRSLAHTKSRLAVSTWQNNKDRPRFLIHNNLNTSLVKVILINLCCKWEIQ